MCWLRAKSATAKRNCRFHLCAFKAPKRTHLTRSVTPDRACPGLDPGIRGPDGSVARVLASYKICNSEAQLQVLLMCF